MKSRKDKLNEFYRLFAEANDSVEALPMETKPLLATDTSDEEHSYTSFDEKCAILLGKSHRLTPQSAKRFYVAAVTVSWLSVVIALGLGTLAIFYAFRQDSQLLFSFGLDSILDAISSFVVLWRFYGGNSIYSEERERRACVIVGVLFILSACLLAIKSIVALVNGERTEEPTIALTLSSVNAATCFITGFSKIFIGYMLESRVLITDSVITLTGAVMSVFTLAFATLYAADNRLWYMDDVIGLICSLFLTSYGIWILCTTIREMKSASTTAN